MINFTEFTPLSSFIGGLIIGLAAVLLLFTNGRIAGISGIIGGLLQKKSNDQTWRIVFILGLILSPFLYTLFQPLPLLNIQTSTPMIMIAGVLVGFGTRLGSGCTSGHGVCGLSRLSLRSFIATLTFMLTGFITVYIKNLFK
jgi:uncharacterized protein